MREKLGGKGANLAEMALIGLPVPPGFTLSTEVCTSFYANNGKYPVGLEAEVSQAVAVMLRSSRVNVLVIRQTLCCSRSAQVRGNPCQV